MPISGPRRSAARSSKVRMTSVNIVVSCPRCAPHGSIWFAPRPQVSWLAGQSAWPCLPEPSPVQWPTLAGWTGQRLAADSCGGSRRLAPGPAAQPGRTAFPFHPLARDRRRATVASDCRGWQTDRGRQLVTARRQDDLFQPATIDRRMKTHATMPCLNRGQTTTCQKALPAK